jgi:hypothetical protein
MKKWLTSEKRVKKTGNLENEERNRMELQASPWKLRYHELETNTRHMQEN